MKDKIGKIFAVLLIIAIVIKAVFAFADIKNMNETLELILLTYQEVVLTCAIPFLVFFVDRNKNDSAIGMIGYLMIGVYVLIYVGTIIYSKSLKTDSIKDLESIKNIYKTIENIGKASSVTLLLMRGMEYMSMINIASEETENVIAKYAKMASYLIALVYVILGIVLVFKTESYSGPQTLSNIKSLTYNLFIFSLVLMVGFQYGDLLSEGEVTTPITQNTTPTFQTGQNQLSYGDNGKPLFRNPALEEQERKIAEEKARKEAMQQQMQSPQQGINPQPQVPAPGGVQQPGPPVMPQQAQQAVANVPPQVMPGAPIVQQPGPPINPNQGQ